MIGSVGTGRDPEQAMACPATGSVAETTKGGRARLTMGALPFYIHAHTRGFRGTHLLGDAHDHL